MTGIFSSMRWCAAILTTLALLAGSSALEAERSTASVVTADESVSAVALPTAGQASVLRSSLPKHRRGAQRSQLAIVSTVITECTAATLDGDEGSERAAQPRDSRAAEVHHATGPPAPLLT